MPSIAEKSLAQRAVQEYFAAEAPERLEEVDFVFSDVYDAMMSQLQRKQVLNANAIDGGIPFDAGLIEGTIISTACWIAVNLVIAAAKYSAKRGTAAALDYAEEELTKQGVNPTVLSRLRQIVQGIVEEC